MRTRAAAIKASATGTWRLCKWLMGPAGNRGYDSPEKAASSLRRAQADERRFAMLLTLSILAEQQPGSLTGRTIFGTSGTPAKLPVWLRLTLQDHEV